MRWIDVYFYQPNIWQKTLAILLLPISLLYGIGHMREENLPDFITSLCQ